MSESLARLLEAIEEANRSSTHGEGVSELYDTDWDAIINLAAKVREELNAVPQEDVAGRMERE